jgi:hypothetical protein
MVLPLLLISFYPNKRISPIFQTSLIIGATLALGILVEIFQYGFNRTPDMGDLFRNMIGAFIAICFILPIRESVPKPPMRVLRTIIVLLVASQFYPIVLALIDEHHARRTFQSCQTFKHPCRFNAGPAMLPSPSKTTSAIKATAPCG